MRGRNTSVFCLGSPFPRGLKTDVIPGSPPFRCVAMMLRSKLAGVISVLSPSRIALRRTFAVLRDRKGSDSVKKQHIGQCNATRSFTSRRKESWFGAVSGTSVYTHPHIDRIRSKLHTLCLRTCIGTRYIYIHLETYLHDDSPNNPNVTKKTRLVPLHFSFILSCLLSEEN